MSRALVVGASGYVGSRLVAALVREGHQVVATARDVKKLRAFDFPDAVRNQPLDVSKPEDCTRAFEAAGAVDVAYYLVHTIGSSNFAERDLQAAENFAAAAKAAGAGRIVYLGGFVPQQEDLSEHLESRSEVGQALGATTVELVWLRAAIILGAGSTSYELLRYLAERVPVIPLPSWMQHEVVPIAVDDVLRYLVASADPATVPAGSFDISNGEHLTYADVIKRYAEVSGLQRVWLPLPGISPSIAGPVIAELTPIPRELVVDLVQSLSNTMDSTDTRIRDLVPDPPEGLTTLDDAIVRAAVPKGFVAQGVWATKDPLQLTSTDPRWAGGDAYRSR